MMQEPPLPIFALVGDRAALLIKALNEGKKIELVPDTVEGRQIVKFYVEDEQPAAYYLLNLNLNHIEGMNTTEERALAFTAEEKRLFPNYKIVLAKEVGST